MHEPASAHAVVHYAEIALKGQNRAHFERALARNLARRLRGAGLERVERLPGRMLVRVARPLDGAAWAAALGTVFGVAHFAPAWPVEPTLEAIRAAVLERLPAGPADSFRIRAVRDDKSFPLNSLQISVELGRAVQERTGWPVRLRGAALIIEVEVLHDRALVSFNPQPGPGGLPVGASGRVGLLLSGGIDSPVAGYLALKRGCRVVPIHFHSRPFGNWLGAEARVRAVWGALRPYGADPFFYAVPIGRQQREISVRAPAAYRVLLYRRLMLRVAAQLTARQRGKALVTGESLGQVASQTLDSLVAVEQAAPMPVLRPLIGMDKREIVALAKRIGTFAPSQMAADDCCQFLLPRGVVNHPRLEDVLQAEQQTEMDRLVGEALAQARRVRIDTDSTDYTDAHG